MKEEMRYCRENWFGAFYRDEDPPPREEDNEPRMPLDGQSWQRQENEPSFWDRQD